MPRRCPVTGHCGEDAALSPDGIATNYAFYGRLNGTPMTAPHTAGVAALLPETDPDLTPVQVQTIPSGTVKDFQAQGRDVEAGGRLVDAPEALVAMVQAQQDQRSEEAFMGFRWSRLS